MKTETFYRKVGRRYLPVSSYWAEETSQSRQAVGTFRLIYAYKDGGRRYEYDVTPATAPTVAAMMIAKTTIEDAVREAARMRPSSPQAYTAKQLKTIAKFREEMGGMMPSWWTEGSAYDISEAAIKAVMEFRP